jgi:hypothetical protein
LDKTITRREMMTEDNRDPLEAVHDIGRVVRDLGRTISAMRILGMNDGADDLAWVQEAIEGLAKEAAAGICRESHEMFADTQKRTGEMLCAVLDSCLSQHESH